MPSGSDDLENSLLHLVAILLTLIGTFKVFFLVLSCFVWLWRLTYAFILPGNINLKQFGKWGVVTGCTEGIGKAYATSLAQMGIDLVLISRNEDKLQALATSLQQVYQVKTEIIVADFKYSSIYNRIQAILHELDICVLVNNVGISYYRPGRFLEVDPRVHSEMLNINSLSCLMLTHLVLPRMLDKDKGVVINISSETGNKPYPLLATYSGTKSLMNYFTMALQYEYRSSNVIIQLVCPLAVQTRIDFQMPQILAPLPDTYVRSALKSVGRLSETRGCLSHEIQYSIRNLLLPEVFDIDKFVYYRLCENLKKLDDLRN